MDKPLSGLTVVDFSKFLPGPYCTWLLAELGADVIRIENPREVAKQRKVFGWDKLSFEELESLRAQDILARGKKSVMLDPGNEFAREAIYKLIESADMLVEDYRPGVMTSMGYGYEQLKTLNERLIYCSVTLCGQQGPLASKPGHDPVAMAISGALSRLGEAPEKPAFAGVPVADLLSGSNAVIGILAAVISRQTTGKGQHIDIAMSDASMMLIINLLSRHSDLNNLPPKGMPRADSGIWQTSDHQYVVTTDMEPRYWQQFCEIIERPEYVARQMDKSSWPAMKADISDIIKQQSLAYWCDKFERAGTQYAPVLSVAEALTHEHNMARDMIRQESLADGQSVVHLNSPIRLAGMSSRSTHLGRVAGADTVEVLTALGIPQEAIASLTKELS